MFGRAQSEANSPFSFNPCTAQSGIWFGSKNLANSVTGELLGSGCDSTHVTYSWIIKDFGKIETSRGACLKSADLLREGSAANWCLTIASFSETDEAFTSCFLCCTKSPEDGVYAKGVICFKNVEQKIIRLYDQPWFYSFVSSHHGLMKFADRNDLMQDLIDDTLIVAVDLTYTFSYTSMNGTFDNHPTISPFLATSTNFHRLLEDSRDSDITISVRGTDFPAHRLVLVTHSPVFRSMFEHDTLEQTTRRVELSDVEPEVMRRFLLFVYTGTVTALYTSMALDLLQLADKYDVEHLKDHCIDFLIPRFDMDNIAQILVSADLLNVPRLRIKAVQYFCKNKSSFDYERYQLLLEERPKLLIEIVKQVGS